VIKFVSDLRQVGGFLWVSSTNKTDRHDINEILLRVALKPPLSCNGGKTFERFLKKSP
jgi:hypothetical protein